MALHFLISPKITDDQTVKSYEGLHSDSKIAWRDTACELKKNKIFLLSLKIANFQNHQEVLQWRPKYNWKNRLRILIYIFHLISVLSTFSKE